MLNLFLVCENNIVVQFIQPESWNEEVLKMHHEGPAMTEFFLFSICFFFGFPDFGEWSLAAR
jgi:hypothetical protein